MYFENSMTMFQRSNKSKKLVASQQSDGRITEPNQFWAWLIHSHEHTYVLVTNKMYLR